MLGRKSMNKAKQFFQKEYLDNKQTPALMLLNGKEYVIPRAYLNQTSDLKLAQDNFIDDFFDAQQQDLSLYEENKIEPKEIVWTDGKTKYTFFVPFALKDKNLSNSEIVSMVFKKAERKYRKAARYAQHIQQAYPNSKKTYGVSTADVKSLRKQYHIYLWNKTKDKTKYGALLVGDFARKGIKIGAKAVKIGTEKIVELTPEKFKKIAKRYALVTLVGGASLAGSTHALRSAFSLPKQDLMEQVLPLSDEQFSELETNLEKLSSDQNLKEVLKEKKQIVSHNKQVFLDNINELKAVLCFMENFADSTFLDGKGVPTIGYGCTYFIDENGKGDRDISPVKLNMTMTMEEANVQKDRYLMYRVLPQIMRDVKVPLSGEEMIASCSFAYVVGPGNFKSSEYLSALNRGVKGAKLGRYLLGYAKDQGVVKRNLFANYILTKKLKPVDFLDLRTEGCYTLEMDDCCFMSDGCVKRDKNGLGRFKDDRFEENLAKAKLNRYSPKIGPCLLVHEVLSEDVVNIVKKHAQTKNASLLQLLAEKIGCER